MKIAVVYFSKTGHSKKIAEAIATELQIQAQDIKTEPKLNGVDLLFIVGGIYASKSDPKMISFIEKVDRSMIKKAALITSCVSKRIKQEMVRETLLRNRIEVLPEEFLCQGSFLFVGVGHPNKSEIDDAVLFAKKVTI